MWRTQLVAGVIVSTTAVLVVLDRISIAALTLLAFALGTCDVVFSNAAQALLPGIVARQVLHRANGNQQAVITAGQQFVGPPVGSGLFAVAAALPFAVDACSFLVCASLLARLPEAQHPVRERQSMRAAIACGWTWLKRHRLIRTLAALLGVNAFCGQMANAVLVLLATQVLNVNAQAYGVLLATAAVGSVLGGVVNARIVRRTGPLAALVTGLVANIVALAGVGFSPDPFVLGGFLALNGFATTMWNVVTTTLRQELVPSTVLGRVTSVYKMVGWGMIPAGTLAGGSPTPSACGPRTSLPPRYGPSRSWWPCRSWWSPVAPLPPMSATPTRMRNPGDPAIAWDRPLGTAAVPMVRTAAVRRRGVGPGRVAGVVVVRWLAAAGFVVRGGVAAGPARRRSHPRRRAWAPGREDPGGSARPGCGRCARAG